MLRNQKRRKTEMIFILMFRNLLFRHSNTLKNCKHETTFTLINHYVPSTFYTTHMRAGVDKQRSKIRNRRSFLLSFVLFLIICFILSTTCSEVKHSEEELIISEMKLREDYEKATELFRSLAGVLADYEC